MYGIAHSTAFYTTVQVSNTPAVAVVKKDSANQRHHAPTSHFFVYLNRTATALRQSLCQTASEHTVSVQYIVTLYITQTQNSPTTAVHYAQSTGPAPAPSLVSAAGSMSTSRIVSPPNAKPPLPCPCPFRSPSAPLGDLSPLGGLLVAREVGVEVVHQIGWGSVVFYLSPVIVLLLQAERAYRVLLQPRHDVHLEELPDVG